MKSMSGFGRSEKETPLGKLIVEIQSVNRKYFELYVFLPKEYSRFEQDIRKQIGEQNLRGLVSVRVHLFPNISALEGLLPDPRLFDALRKGWEEIADSLGYGKQVIDFPFLVQHVSELPQQSLVKKADFDPISLCLKEALIALDRMKQTEGGALSKDVESRLQYIAHALETIEQCAPNAVEKLRQKLKVRMEELLQPGIELDERLFREVALYAERVDISEEITRIRSHLSQYQDLLKSKAGLVGRKMDFLTQEIGREMNTIGSKSMDTKIAHLVVDMKSELEKIREQIQNIE